jgi:REP element-mobilizing transposase RayT
MSRGDRREDIYLDDVDRQDLLKTLAEACQKTGFQVHAYCLMRNHFHLVVQTPEANLVAGMAWLLSAYTIRFNGTSSSGTCSAGATRHCWSRAAARAI